MVKSIEEIHRKILTKDPFIQISSNLYIFDNLLEEKNTHIKLYKWSNKDRRQGQYEVIKTY